MNTKKDFSNKLLKRRELVLVLEKESNPGYEYVKKEVAQKFKSDESLVVVKKVGSGFGSGEFEVDVLIYGDKETMDKIEPRKKEKKKA